MEQTLHKCVAVGPTLNVNSLTAPRVNHQSAVEIIISMIVSATNEIRVNMRIATIDSFDRIKN